MNLQNKIISSGVKSALKQKSLVSKILNMIGIVVLSLISLGGLVLLFDGSAELMMRFTMTLLVTYPSIYILFNRFSNKISIMDSIKKHFLLWLNFISNLIFGSMIYYMFNVGSIQIIELIITFPILYLNFVGDFSIIEAFRKGTTINEQYSIQYIRFVPEPIRNFISSIINGFKSFLNWLTTSAIGKVILSIGLGYLIKSFMSDSDEEDLSNFSMDTDGDGIIDTVGMDTDGDGIVDTVSMDTDGDGIVDTVSMDTDGDGIVDTVSMDTDGDGLADSVAVDIDGDGVADTIIDTDKA